MCIGIWDLIFTKIANKSKGLKRANNKLFRKQTKTTITHHPNNELYKQTSLGYDADVTVKVKPISKDVLVFDIYKTILSLHDIHRCA